MKTRKEKIYTVTATETNYLRATRVTAATAGEAEQKFQEQWDNGDIPVVNSHLDISVAED